MSDNHDTLYHSNGEAEIEGDHDPSTDEETILTDEEYGSPESSLEEVQDEEIADYFLEISGRLYASHGGAPYPLPVDTPENDRTKANHTILKRLIGANHRGPVTAVLAVNLDRQPRVLDLCCGVGTWVKDMSADFPHAQIIGVDIVPLATRYPPANVQFEILDVNSPLRWTDGYFDLIHSRDVILSVCDYGTLVNEVARTLRPGGLFLSVEWSNHISLHPSIPGDVETHAPASTHFYDTVNYNLATLGVNPDGSAASNFTANSPHFTSVTVEQIDVPIGTWHPEEGLRQIGSSFRAAQKRLAHAYKRMLLTAGMSSEAVDTLIDDFVHDLYTTDGLMMTVYLTSAERV